MTSWSALYERFNTAEQQRAHAATLAAEEERARRVMDAWSDEATARLLGALCATAVSQAQSFAAATGAVIDVSYPSQPTLEWDREGLRMSFMKLRLGNSEVDLYSFRKSGSPPIIHMVAVNLPAAPRQRRPNAHQLHSIPLAIVCPSSDSWCRLLQASTAGAAQRTTTIEQIVFAAFELLVGGYTRS